MTHIFRTFPAISGWTGRFFLTPIFYIINLTTFIIFALRDWTKNTSLLKKNSYQNLVKQLIFTGVDALPSIALLAIITGFLFTFRLIAIVDSVGGSDDLVNILVNVIGLEIAPLLTAFILISRTGSAIVVDIGNMKLHGEIEGLEYLSININHFFVAPRLLGCAISQLALTVYYTTITMVTGIIISGFMLSAEYLQLLSSLPTAISPAMLFGFIIKNLSFGLIIAAAACYHGLKVIKSPTEVPQQTQQAITNSLITIFIIDGFMGLALVA